MIATLTPIAKLRRKKEGLEMYTKYYSYSLSLSLSLSLIFYTSLIPTLKSII
jgi:hypothetical protein